ncbi:MAG: 2-C-methyl-D-erythritol 4-phosphate cytidylyltransferase, partial [Myxococcota bacterium]
FLPVRGRPMLYWSLRAFAASDAIRAIAVVAPAGEEGRAREVAGEARANVWTIVAGGATRQDSLGAGLNTLADLTGEDPLVVVHDAARPLVRPIDIGRVAIAAERRGGAILAVPVKDTIKIVREDERIASTPERSSLWIAQTPQAARASLLRQGLARAQARGTVSTDEAGLLELLGMRVPVVLGDYENIKVTTADDVIVAEAFLAAREGRA